MGTIPFQFITTYTIYRWFTVNYMVEIKESMPGFILTAD